MARTVPALDPAERRDAIAGAVRAMRNGRLVGLPAEQGYVLAADAFSSAGVAALQRAKNLSPTTSLGVLVGRAGALDGISIPVTAMARDMIAACWPGQFGLVVRMQPSLRWTVPTDRFVVRMPLHPVLLAVVGEVGPTVYSACTGDELRRADLILDCGDRPDGPGSTIVDATTAPPRLLRRGAVPAERLLAIAPGLRVEP